MQSFQQCYFSVPTGFENLDYQPAIIQPKLGYRSSHENVHSENGTASPVVVIIVLDKNNGTGSNGSGSSSSSSTSSSVSSGTSTANGGNCAYPPNCISSMGSNPLSTHLACGSIGSAPQTSCLGWVGDRLPSMYPRTNKDVHVVRPASQLWSPPYPSYSSFVSFPLREDGVGAAKPPNVPIKLPVSTSHDATPSPPRLYVEAVPHSFRPASADVVLTDHAAAKSQDLRNCCLKQPSLLGANINTSTDSPSDKPHKLPNTNSNTTTTTTNNNNNNNKAKHRAHSIRGQILQRLQTVKPLEDCPQKPWMCPECNCRYTTFNGLQSHFRIHTEWCFKCETCNRRFARSRDFQEHMRVHTNERPFVCRFCHKGFKQRHNLKDHERTHTREDLFACDICHKTFVAKHNMKNHRKLHSNN